MGLRNKNGRWEYRFQVHGQSIRESTGLEAIERNKTKAARMEAAHRQAILEGRLGIRKLTPRSFIEASHEFIQHIRAIGRQESTVRRIETSMASLRVFFGDSMVSMIPAGRVEQYIGWRLNEHKVKPVTVKHDVDNLSLLFKFSIKMDYARENPVAGVDKPSDKDAVRIRVLSDAEEARYFAVATGNLRDVARLILLQGARPDEVLTMRKADVDLAAGTWSIPRGKTRAARRTLKLTAESQAIIGARMASLGPWVFASPKDPERHITKLNCPHDRALRKTPGLEFVLYDLRHTFASRLAMAGVDLATIAAILGHADIRITQKYVHPSKDHQFAAMALMERLNVKRSGRVM